MVFLFVVVGRYVINYFIVVGIVLVEVIDLFCTVEIRISFEIIILSILDFLCNNNILSNNNVYNILDFFIL